VINTIFSAILRVSLKLRL